MCVLGVAIVAMVILSSGTVSAQDKTDKQRLEDPELRNAISEARLKLGAVYRGRGSRI
jgi:hypothetical protein